VPNRCRQTYGLGRRLAREILENPVKAAGSCPTGKDISGGGKESPSRDWCGREVMLFMRTLGKLLFPHLQSDQRRKRMNTILLVVLVVLAFGGTVGALSHRQLFWP
jgi:hypothetical protein